LDGVPALGRQGSVVVSSFHPELAEDDRIHRWFVEQE
ncbi:MAG: pyridoxal 5'-phosphate synthase glutaminase subunit PdxT, partial [Acidimicrobiia bacterium]|nr:pyridoxal 5'-phosphate synthase glutaminase subunit PdxT [Acidimicrobiia bacterium]